MTGRTQMTYEAWRLSFQSDEQAARTAYAEMLRLSALLHHQAASAAQPATEAAPCV